MIPLFIEALTERLRIELPGKNAQRKMMITPNRFPTKKINQLRKRQLGPLTTKQLDLLLKNQFVLSLTKQLNLLLTK